jgi:NADPH-dependent curcumin reductase CurA
LVSQVSDENEVRRIVINKQITLAARPDGFPVPSDFQLIESPFPEPQAGEVLVRTVYLSVDPYMRGRIRDRKSYAEPVKIGDVMVGEVVGVVEKSRDSSLAEGEFVRGHLGWQQYATCTADRLRRVKEGLPISTALHVVGMPGLTGYFGLLTVCGVKPGETVVVSGGAGAVGTTVGQIAKIKGCRVVGVAGSDEKIDFITNELGFDAGINYKTAEIYPALKAACPDGIDAYFDNVGGTTTDAVFNLINVHGRMAICGQISQYNLTEAEYGPRLLWNLITKRAKVEGLLVSDFVDRYGEALKDLHAWVHEGKIKYRERVTEGIENAAQAFIEMLGGANIGKQLVRVSKE